MAVQLVRDINFQAELLLCVQEGIRSVAPRTATAVYFKLVTSLSNASRSLIQFVPHYRLSTRSGKNKLRITTIARSFAEAGSSSVV